MAYVLWGTKKGNPVWMEEVITETESTKNLESAKQWAVENEFENLRVLEIGGYEVPDFAKAINI